MDQPQAPKKSYQIHPVGVIHNSGADASVEIYPPFRSALKQLDQFSHVIVIWWADKHDNPKSRATYTCNPPYADDRLTGVFACRAEYRPNPVAITTCQILHIDEQKGILQVPWLDAEDGTPVIDLKAYFPVCDRVRDVQMPDWLVGWPECVEDAYKLEF